MVCYQVNLITTKFKLKNIDLIIETLKDLKLNPSQMGNIIYFGLRESIDLERNTITVINNNTSNLINRKYSEKIIELAAKKKKWILNKNRQEIRKY